MKDTSDNKTTQKPEPETERWHCDIYCRHVRHVTCPGKEGIDPESEKACPYLDEMLY